MVPATQEKLPLYIPVGLVCWYFYGMLLNSMRLGIDAVFHNTGQDVTAIWIFDPIRNWLAIFSGFGLKATAFFVLMFGLVTKRGYLWFSGYKYTRDPRGFDILPDGTHGSSGFLTKREMEAFLEIGPIQSVSGMLLGKIKERPEDPDKYAAYVAHRMVPGENNNLLCIGAPGSWKTRGLILPFLMGCAQRKESVFCVDPKGELFEQLSPYFRENGHYVKAVNFLDMAHSDGWNCLYGLDTETDLVQTVANTIIQNTSSPKEADDFWSRAELNLLMALIHHVCNLRDDKGDLLPIEQRGLGDVYQILATMSVNELNRTLASLPPDHPAKGHHGLFLKARENLWGNIITGLGNRLAIFQNKLVDTITRNHDVDLVLPGQRPCAYFIIIPRRTVPTVSQFIILFLGYAAAFQLRTAPLQGRAAAGAGKLLSGRILQHRLHGRHCRRTEQCARLQYRVSGGGAEPQPVAAAVSRKEWEISSTPLTRPSIWAATT